jgi:hypothetical protein
MWCSRRSLSLFTHERYHHCCAPWLQAFDELLLLKPGGHTIFSGALGPDQSRLIGHFESMPVSTPLLEALRLGALRAGVSVSNPHCRRPCQLLAQQALESQPAVHLFAAWPLCPPCRAWPSLPRHRPTPPTGCWMRPGLQLSATSGSTLVHCTKWVARLRGTLQWLRPGCPAS